MANRKKLYITLSVLLVIVLLPALLMGVTFYSNDVELFKSPGFAKRLSVYLSQNTASTDDNHPFPELRMRQYGIEAFKLYRYIRKTARKLGWEIESEDEDNQSMHLVVKTPWAGFKDDVYVQVIYLQPRQSTLLIKSSSRVGKADFGVNVAHITKLVKSFHYNLGMR